jgi:hypothetical protein
MDRTKYSRATPLVSSGRIGTSQPARSTPPSRARAVPKPHRTAAQCVLRQARTPTFVFFVFVGAACLAVGCHAPTSNWIGINTELGHGDYGGQWTSAKNTAADREIYFRLVQELGVKNVRDLFMSWYRVEPREGQAYDFSVSDDIARRAGEAGVDLLALCWVIPSWAAEDQTGAAWSFGVPRRDKADAFVRFVTAFVERYDGDDLVDLHGLKRPVHCYEFLNEMEAVPVAEYAFWLKLFYQTVKAADPWAKVVLGSLGSPGYRMATRPTGDYHTYFDRLMASGQLAGRGYPYFDAVGFHNFPSSYPGRTPFANAALYLQQVLERHGVDRPIWLTEFGCDSRDSEPGGQSAQAAEIVKMAIEARALGIERAYLHNLWDYRLPGHPDVIDTFGLVREAASGQVPVKKPAFEAFRVLNSLAGECERITRVRPGVYAIKSAAGVSYIAWQEEGRPAATGNGLLSNNWWIVTSLDGKTTTLHGSAIKLTGSPVFLRMTQSPLIRQ